MEPGAIASSSVWDSQVSLLRLICPTSERLCFDSVFQYEAMEIAAGDPRSPGRHRDIAPGLCPQAADGLPLAKSQGPGAGVQGTFAPPGRRPRRLPQGQPEMGDVQP